MAKRTTHRSTAGKKLYAVRDKEGKFEDIQTYKKAHGADVKRKSRKERMQRVAKRFSGTMKRLAKNGDKRRAKAETPTKGARYAAGSIEKAAPVYDALMDFLTKMRSMDRKAAIAFRKLVEQQHLTQHGPLGIAVADALIEFLPKAARRSALYPT
jgi:type I site-specific restriction endonuclease